MAILKDLIVHGSSRFLNKIYANEIQTPLIEAEAGIIKKLKADNATVVGLLDVKGQLHTNSWSNSNIATIDGSFYITPTIESASGTVSITASSLAFSGTNYAVSSLYLGDGSSITWPQYSKVLVTGQVSSNGEWIPLGTLLGQLSNAATATSISINSIKDNKNQNSNVLATLVSNGTTNSNYRNLKVSLYQRATSSTDFRPLGIYMTATGTNGRTFLDIYGGVESLSNSNNYGGFAEPNVRIGNLQGLPNVGGQTPSGWGIYTDNGYFKGIIAADQGYIGSGSKYWVIANEEDLSNSENSRSYIYNGTNNIASTVEGVYLGTDGIRNYKDSTHHVTIKNGVITALGVILTGEITASSGSIGGWNIGTDTNKSLYYGNQTPGATTTNLILSPTSATNSNAIGGSGTGLKWFISAGKVFGVTTAGALYATSGKIGGWTIGTSSLYNSKSSYNNSNEGLYLGTDYIAGGAGEEWWFKKDGSAKIGTMTLSAAGVLSVPAANISGTLTANQIDVSSINIGNLNGVSNYAQKTDVTNAIDNLQIGGRNLILQTITERESPASSSGSAYVSPTPTISDYGNLILNNMTDYFTYSFDYEVTGNTAENAYIYVQIRGSSISNGNPYTSKVIADEPIGKYSTTFKLTNAQVTATSKSAGIRLRNATDGAKLLIKNIKLEKGNKATDWTPAPEDVDETINNIEIGGRNLILDTATPHSSRTDDIQYIANYMMSDYGKSLMNNTEDYFTLSFDYEIQGDYSTASDNSRIYAMINGTAVSPPNPIYVKNSSSTGHYSTTCKMTQAQVDSTADACRVRWNEIVEGCTFTVKNYKVEKGTKETTWTPAPEDTQENINNVSTVANTALGQSVEYIIGTQTAATGSWTGKTNDSSLITGKTIAYKLPYAGSGNASLNLTLANGTTTGAKAVYLNTTRVTTHFGAGSIIQMTYNGTDWRVTSIPNSDTVGTYGVAGAIAGTNANNQSDTTIFRYTLIMKKVDGNNPRWVSLVTSSGTGTSKTRYTGGLYLDEILYMGTNVSTSPYGYASETASGTSYRALNIDLRYSTNCGSTLTKGKPVYLVGTINPLDGLFYLDPTWWTQTEPTIEDGKTYIYIGQTYSTYQVYLSEKKPIMRYYRGAFRTEEQIAGMTATSYITYINANDGIQVHNSDDLTDYIQINSDAISMYRGSGLNDTSEETLRIGDSAIRIGKTGEGQKNVYIDSDSIDIRNNENVLASFTGEDIKFYDGGIEELEIASFGGANGVRIGSEKEVHFVIKNNEIKAQNENGSPVFSIETTEGLVGNVEKIANSGLVSTKNQTRTIETENLTSNSTFYTEQIRLMLEIVSSHNDLGGGAVSPETLKFNSFKINNKENEITQYNFQDSYNVARWRFITYLSTKDYSFIFGTSKTVTLSLEGVLRHPNTNGETTTSTLQRDISIIYNGNNQIIFTPFFTSNSPFNNGSPLALGENNTYYVYNSIMSYNTNSKAPALTFGTRLGTVSPLSTTIGESLYAPNRGQMTIGKFNYGQDTQTSTYSFVVGNGQDDTQRSNAFTVDWNGNVGIQGKIHNIIISGGTETKLPLFHFESKTWNISSISANGAWYGPSGNDSPLTRSINVSGYTAIAIAGYSVWGGTNSGWCVVPRVYIDRNLTDNYGNPTDDMLQMYIWNQGSQAATNVKFTVEILYIANNFID